jgi:hypothetical protein
MALSYLQQVHATFVNCSTVSLTHALLCRKHPPTQHPMSFSAYQMRCRNSC